MWLLERNAIKAFLDNNFLLGVPLEYRPLWGGKGVHSFQKRMCLAFSPFWWHICSGGEWAAQSFWKNTGLGVQKCSVIPGVICPPYLSWQPVSKNHEAAAKACLRQSSFRTSPYLWLELDLGKGRRRLENHSSSTTWKWNHLPGLSPDLFTGTGWQLLWQCCKVQHDLENVRCFYLVLNFQRPLSVRRSIIGMHMFLCFHMGYQRVQRACVWAVYLCVLGVCVRTFHLYPQDFWMNFSVQ